MGAKAERIVGFTSLVFILISGVLLYIVTPASFSDPISAEYLFKVILYPAVLIFVRFLWKTFLDNKIKSKAERQADLEKMIEEDEDKK